MRGPVHGSAARADRRRPGRRCSSSQPHTRLLRGQAGHARRVQRAISRLHRGSDRMRTAPSSMRWKAGWHHPRSARRGARSRLDPRRRRESRRHRRLRLRGRHRTPTVPTCARSWSRSRSARTERLAEHDGRVALLDAADPPVVDAGRRRDPARPASARSGGIAASRPPLVCGSWARVDELRGDPVARRSANGLTKRRLWAAPPVSTPGRGELERAVEGGQRRRIEARTARRTRAPSPGRGPAGRSP